MKAKTNILPILKCLLPLLFAFTFAAPAARAGDSLIQVVETGHIDWSAGVVRVNGVGTHPAIEDGASPDSPSDIQDVALRVARSNLLETVGAIRINSVSRVADRMVKHMAFREGLIALARNAAITRQEYLSDGTVEIELTMNLTGGFAQFVLPEEIRQVDSVTPVNGAATAADRSLQSAGNMYSMAYTGLILDATGIGAEPSLVPVVVDESGEVVYGPAFVSREFAVSRGVSGFAATLQAAREDRRVGDRPMVIKVIRTRSTGKTDLVISNADGARVRSSVVHLNFLKACRVSIVMDPPADP